MIDINTLVLWIEIKKTGDETVIIWDSVPEKIIETKKDGEGVLRPTGEVDCPLVVRNFFYNERLGVVEEKEKRDRRKYLKRTIFFLTLSLCSFLFYFKTV